MPQFIATYHGGEQPETPEHGKEGMDAWMKWAQGLGAALVNPGSPVGITKVLTADGVADHASPHPLMGYSVVEADSMEAAIELLQDCPHLHFFNGTLEVSEIMEMPGM